MRTATAACGCVVAWIDTGTLVNSPASTCFIPRIGPGFPTPEPARKLTHEGPGALTQSIVIVAVTAT